MVVFEGWGASGKGRLINRLIQPLDPRGFKVISIQKATEEEERHPLYVEILEAASFQRQDVHL